MELSGVEFGPGSALHTPALCKSLTDDVFADPFSNVRKDEWALNQQKLQMRNWVALAT